MQLPADKNACARLARARLARARLACARITKGHDDQGMLAIDAIRYREVAA